MGQLFSTTSTEKYPLLGNRLHPKVNIRALVEANNVKAVENLIFGLDIDDSLIDYVTSKEMLIILLKKGYKIQSLDTLLYNALPDHDNFSSILTYLNKEKLITKKDVSLLFYSMLILEKAYPEDHFKRQLNASKFLWNKFSDNKHLDLSQILSESHVGKFIVDNL